VWRYYRSAVPRSMEESSNMSAWKRMSSGRYIDLYNFTENDVDIYDINKSLNLIVRFDGHYGQCKPLTVAQHSWLTCYLARMFEPDNTALHLACLTHDFAESYIGDVATPAKAIMGDAWVAFADPIERTVSRAILGYEISPEMKAKVKRYDTLSLDIERRVMWDGATDNSKWPKPQLNILSYDETKTYFFLANEGHVYLPRHLDMLMDKYKREQYEKAS